MSENLYKFKRIHQITLIISVIFLAIGIFIFFFQESIFPIDGNSTKQVSDIYVNIYYLTPFFVSICSIILFIIFLFSTFRITKPLIKLLSVLHLGIIIIISILFFTLGYFKIGQYDRIHTIDVDALPNDIFK